MQSLVWIGTSGWSYKHWHQSFYPKGLPANRLLSFYMPQFPTVEINATFYRLPSPAAVQKWHDQAEQYPNFIYAVKGSRWITHYRKLHEVQNELRTFLDRMSPLSEHIGPVLWQLPPNFSKDLERLRQFAAQLPSDRRHAVEFRHPSWFDPEVADLLAEHDIAQVWISSNRMPMNFTLTSDFVYARFHGLQHGAAHDYTPTELQPWAREFRSAARKKHKVYAYFNNDWNTRAPQNARLLMEMVGDYAVQPSESILAPR